MRYSIFRLLRDSHEVLRAVATENFGSHAGEFEENRRHAPDETIRETVVIASADFDSN